MPTGRRRSKHLRPPRPLDPARHAVRRSTRSGEFLVRDVPADRALKAYTCPGCSNAIPVGMPHVVAWPEAPGPGSGSGVEERRHWHRHCWRLNTGG